MHTHTHTLTDTCTQHTHPRTHTHTFIHTQAFTHVCECLLVLDTHSLSALILGIMHSQTDILVNKCITTAKQEGKKMGS